MSNAFQRVAKAIATDLSGLSSSEVETLIGLLRKSQPLLLLPNHSITVDYSASVEQLVEAGKYGWSNDDITSHNFPSFERGMAQVVVYLVNFNSDISSEDVIRELDRQGLRPATLKELLTLGVAQPDLQCKNPIVALDYGYVDVPFLDSCRGGSYRSLNLHWRDYDWRLGCQFAAVRK